MLKNIMAAVVAFIPTIVFAISIILFAPGAFGLSMHPVAIGAMYCGILGPPLSAYIALKPIVAMVQSKWPKWSKEHVHVALIMANYIVSILLLLLVNALLPTLDIDWPRIGDYAG